MDVLLALMIGIIGFIILVVCHRVGTLQEQCATMQDLQVHFAEIQRQSCRYDLDADLGLLAEQSTAGQQHLTTIQERLLYVQEQTGHLVTIFEKVLGHLSNASDQHLLFYETANNQVLLLERICSAMDQARDAARKAHEYARSNRNR